MLLQQCCVSNMTNYFFLPVVTIPCVSKANDGGRLYDRTHACFYCGALSTKIARHLLSKHKEEDIVKAVIKLNVRSQVKERSFLLDKLRFKGDFYHNVKIVKTGGEFIVFRRPTGLNLSYKDFKPCGHCLAFFHQQELWRHTRKCPYKNGNDESSTSILRQSEILLYPNEAVEGSSLELQEFVFRIMKMDNITKVVKSDQLISTYGSFLMCGKGEKKATYISQDMRIMARLLIKLREKYPENANYPLMQFLDPKYFDAIVSCTKDLAGYTLKNCDGEGMPGFKKPSLPLKLGYALDNILVLMKGIGLRRKDQNLIVNADSLVSLYKSEWSVRISSASLRTLADNKFNKQELLPVTDDLLKVKQFCEDSIQHLVDKLKIKPTLPDWRELADIIVCRITIFNKRRGNEASSVLLKRFTSRKENNGTVHTDILESLTPLEQKLMER